VIVAETKPSSDYLRQEIEKRHHSVTCCSDYRETEDLVTKCFRAGKHFPSLLFVDDFFAHPLLSAVGSQEGSAIIHSIQCLCTHYNHPKIQGVMMENIFDIVKNLDSILNSLE
jgi:hypothetical protein